MRSGHKRHFEQAIKQIFYYCRKELEEVSATMVVNSRSISLIRRCPRLNAKQLRGQLWRAFKAFVTLCVFICAHFCNCAASRLRHVFLPWHGERCHQNLRYAMACLPEACRMVPSPCGMLHLCWRVGWQTGIACAKSLCY